jgi:FixJ family two-component response regulator
MNSTDPTLFLIERDALERARLERLLSSEGYRVRTYADSSSFIDEEPDACCGCLIIAAGEDNAVVELLHRRDDAGLPPVASVLTGRGDVATAVRVLKAGAVDVLTKPVDFRALSESIDRTFELVIQLGKHRWRLRELRLRISRLTPREREVFGLVITGLLNKQIAAELGATERTIKAHRRRVMEKCEVRSVAELVHIAEVIEQSQMGRHPVAGYDPAMQPFAGQLLNGTIRPSIEPANSARTLDEKIPPRLIRRVPGLYEKRAAPMACRSIPNASIARGPALVGSR